MSLALEKSKLGSLDWSDIKYLKRRVWDLSWFLTRLLVSVAQFAS
jgi:hypothetical protein